MTRRRTLFLRFAMVSAVGLSLLGAAIFVFDLSYDVSALRPHTRPVHAMLEKVMHHAVDVRSRGIEAPPSLSAERGAACYRDTCAQCHGGPGVAPGPIGMGMQPLPGPLVDAARRWELRHVYWITRNGIKMTGMPAWEYRLADDDLWAVSGFVQQLAQLSPADYAKQMESAQDIRCLESTRCVGAACVATQTVAVDDDDWINRAQIALGQYACTACHVIPGTVGPETHVGPPLAGLGARQLLGGRLPNTPQNLARWIRDPKAIDPATAMPDLSVSEEHATLMARYLATLR